MAYMSQERKKGIAAKLKAALEGTGIKYSLAVRNGSTLVCTISKAQIDFLANYNAAMASNPYKSQHWMPAEKHLDVNPYHWRDYFTGDVLNIIGRIMACLNDGNHDRSDLQSDYFDVGWYVDLQIGKWDKPFELIGGEG